MVVVIFEDVQMAERFSALKPGYRLLACETAVLPVFVVNAPVLLQQHKTVPPIDEYVLRCVNESILTSSAISKFLGIDEETVSNTVTRLWQSDLVDSPIVQGERSLQLTSEGIKALNNLVEVVPFEKDVYFSFDRILWKPVPIATNLLLNPKFVVDQDYLKIRPSKKVRPVSSDISARSVDIAIKVSMGLEMSDVDVLVVKTIDRLDEKYLICNLLIYESIDRKDHAIEVVVDGRINSEISAALDNLGGATYLGIAFDPPAIETQSESKDLELLASSFVSPPAALDEVFEMRRTRAVEIEEFEKISGSPSDDIPVQKSDLGLDGIDIRFIDTFEHRPYMDKAISEATGRLLITSPWVRDGVVRRDLMDALYDAAKRGVLIHIGYGITADAENCDNSAIDKLNRFSEKFNNVVVTCLGSTHAKILIWDDNSISGSFNWLSFRGDAHRTYRQEHSILVMNHVSETSKLWQEQKEWIERSSGKIAERHKSS